MKPIKRTPATAQVSDLFIKLSAGFLQSPEAMLALLADSFCATAPSAIVLRSGEETLQSGQKVERVLRIDYHADRAGLPHSQPPCSVRKRKRH